MHFLVNATKRGLQSVFISSLYRESLIPELLAEKPEVVERRRHLTATLNLLEGAIWELQEIPADLFSAFGTASLEPDLVIHVSKHLALSSAKCVSCFTK